MNSTPIFDNDKDNFPSSAISLRLKYIQLPRDYYITGGDYTITAWVKLYSFTKYCRLIDIGNNAYNDGVVFALTTSQHSLFQAILNTDKSASYLTTPKENKLFDWSFVSSVLDKTQLRVYVNGNLVASGDMLTPTNVLRSTNYIGKSLYPNDELVDGSFSDLMIYNTALTAEQLNSIMKSGNYLKL